MDDNSLSEQRKQEKEYKELTHRNREWIGKQIDLLAELLLELWLRKKKTEHRKESDNTGSNPTHE